MKFPARIGGCLILVCLLLTSTGCRYLTNRYYDMRDTFAVGVGVTTENPVTGVVPPSLGVYLDLTDLFQFGAIHYNGYTAELDMRGSFIGPEAYTRVGFLWWQMLYKNQSYENALYYNKFKDEKFAWCHRMESVGMTKYGRAAKEVHYERIADYKTHGTWLLHRGWQYWEYTGLEFAISEPFLTHAGLMARFGIDLSEVSDFVLGWVLIDFKHDDMNKDEYWLYLDNPELWGLRLVPARPRHEPAHKAGKIVPPCPVEKADPKPVESAAPKAPRVEEQPKVEAQPQAEEKTLPPPPPTAPLPGGNGQKSIVTPEQL